MSHELIVLPSAARPHILEKLRSDGIDVRPSQKSAPAKLKDAGVIYACRANNGNAEIMITDEAGMPEKLRSMVAVLIFPGRGALGDWIRGTTDCKLRQRIHEVLYAFKSEITPQQNSERT